MIPMVSAVLMMGRLRKMWTIPELAQKAGVEIDDVFNAENFLEDVDPASLELIAMALELNLGPVWERQRLSEQKRRSGRRQ